MGEIVRLAEVDRVLAAKETSGGDAELAARLLARRPRRSGVARWKLPQRCGACGAPDSRSRSHARGCPSLPAVSRARLVEIARACEAAWAEKTGRAKKAGAAHG